MKKKHILIIVISGIIVAVIVGLFLTHNNKQIDKKEKVTIRAEKPKDSYKKIKGKIENGKIIIDTLIENNISKEIAYNFVKEIKPVYNLAKIHEGNNFIIFFKNNKFYKFIYDIDFDNYLIAKNENKRWIAKIKKIPYKTVKQKITINIDNSLYDAIINTGEKPELSELLASLYDYDIDFNRDLRKGDRLIAIIEKKYLNGKFKKYGNIVFSSFINNNTRINIIRYTLPNGSTGYYHLDGRAVKKMFLKSPLPFMIVTSRFGFRRHPILGFSAKHNGVDLRARVGTKVRTTANGVVVARGYDRVRGRYIIIRHPNGYRTHYYHLSGIKRKIRRGVRVVQGEIIGYSGNTGRSTGPHLHYGVQKYGRYINPLTLKSPTLKPIPKKYKPKFFEYVRGILNKYNLNTEINFNKNLLKINGEKLKLNEKFKIKN